MFGKIRSIRIRLFVSYIMIVALPIGILAALFVNQSRNLVLQQFEEAESSSVAQFRENVSNHLAALKEISRQIYQNEQLAFYLGRQYGDPGMSAEGFYELLQPLFTNYMNAQPGIARIRILTPNTSLLANDEEISRIDSDPRLAQLHARCMQAHMAVLWEHPPESPGTLYLCRALGYHSDNIGTLLIELSGDVIYGFMKEERTGVIMSLATPDGIIVSSHNPANTGLTMDELLLKIRKGRDATLLVRDSFSLEAHAGEEWRIVKQIPLDHFSRQATSVRNFGLLAALLIFLSTVVLSIILSGNMTSGIRDLSLKMSALKRGDFSIQIDSRRMDEIGKLEQNFNSMVTELDRLIERNYRSEMQKRDHEIRRRDAELYALRSQIDPHFLFNTLEAVVQGVSESREGTAEVIQKLARMFRKTIGRQDGFIPLTEELATVSDYLSILQYRLESRLQFTVKYEDSVRKALIPRFVIQPLVENAAHHGISPSKRGGTIRVAIRRDREDISIRVCDNGVGIDADKLQSIRASLSIHDPLAATEHIGLVNIHERITLLFGSAYGLRIDSKRGEGTRVSVSLPGEYNE